MIIIIHLTGKSNRHNFILGLRVKSSNHASRTWCPRSRVNNAINPNAPLGLESHFGPVRHEWLYRIAPKIIETFKPYHDDNVGTQSAGILSTFGSCALSTRSRDQLQIFVSCQPCNRNIGTNVTFSRLTSKPGVTKFLTSFQHFSAHCGETV